MAASTTKACCALACAVRRGTQPGRVDHHDATGAQLLPVHREDLHAQDLRDPARAQDREPAEEGADPRDLHEPDLPRATRLRLCRSERDLLRQAAQRHHGRRGRDARGLAQSTVGLQPDRQSETRHRAATLHHRPHARKRLHHRSPARRRARTGAQVPRACGCAGACRVRRRSGAPAHLQSVRRRGLHTT